MEYPAKMMSQHFTSMLEHLKVSSLINKTRNNQASSSSTNNSKSNNEKELNNSIDQTDNISVSSPILNNQSNVLAVQKHDQVSSCEKLLANNPNGINVNCNNQVQENGTKGKEENNVGTMSKCNDINNSTRQVTNINNSSCINSKNKNPVLEIEIFPPSSTNCIVNSMGCPIMGLQQHPQQQQQQRKQSFVIKPIKLKNVITQAETYDTLYTRATEVSTWNEIYKSLLFFVC